MVVPDYLNTIRDICGAVAVVKMELLGLQRINHFHRPAQFPIVVSRDDDNLATRRKLTQQLRRLPSRRFIVNQIAKNNEAARTVFAHQFREPA